MLYVDTTTNKAQSIYGTDTYKVGSTTYSITGLAPIGTDLADNYFNPTGIHLSTGGLAFVTTDANADSIFTYGMTPSPDVDIAATVPASAGYVQDTIPAPDPWADTAPFQLTVTNVACFCRGTRIATPGGPVPVEDLRAGDLVTTAGAGARSVRWIGRRSFAGRFLRANPAVLPIRFAARCLDGAVPVRDLLVSPDHAMLLDGVLIPARALVNGCTIAPVSGLDRVDYFHLELDSPDVILAEGAATESYVDDGSRALFHNGASHPDGTAAVPQPFPAPRLEDGPIVWQVRNRLAGARAA